MALKIYLLTQNDQRGWDTFDSCVVVAESEEEARKITPAWAGWGSDTWASRPELVEVTYIGKSGPDNKAGEIICASFNAG